MSHKSSKLPEGWASVSLADVASYSKEKADPGEFGNRKYVGLEHMESGTNEIAGIGDIASVKSTKAVFRTGDVLYGKLRPYLKKVCRPSFDGLCSTDILVYPKCDGLDNGYLLHFLSQDSTAEYATQNAKGINLPRISPKALGEIDFPLPPLAEQSRIVEKIESLQARSSRAKDLLAEVGPLLEQLRQSVLRSAFNGRLTADWRKQNPDVEPASELLARIRTERRERWEAAELAKYEAKGKKPPKNWREKYEAETELEITEDLPDLPYGWCYARADEIVAPDTIITYGIVQPGPNIPGGIPYIRGKDIENGEILSGQLLRTSEKLHEQHSRSYVNEGDVLLCVIRHLKVAFVPEGINNVNLTQGTVRLRPSSIIDGHYLASYLASPIGQSWMLRKHFGNAMPRINVADARAVPVPLAPLQEQREIVARISESLSKVEALKLDTASAESLLAELDQSILAKAFRGDLAPQNSQDEPASELLARIRAEREASKATKKQGKKSLPLPRVAAESVSQKLAVWALDLMLLLDHWGKPVSICALEPALILMQDEVLRQKLLKTRRSNRQPAQSTEQQLPWMKVKLLGYLRAANVIKAVGQNGYELIDRKHLRKATDGDRARAAEAIEALTRFIERRELDEQTARDAIAAQVETSYGIAAV